MSPTLQNTRAQRNAALARSSSNTGRVVNVRLWPLADMSKDAFNVAFGGKADIATSTNHV